MLIKIYVHLLRSNLLQEHVHLDMCSQRRFKSVCAFRQSDQNLHCGHFGYPRMQNVHNANWLDCAEMQTDLSPRCAHMSEGTFSHLSVHMSCLAFRIYLLASQKAHSNTQLTRHALNRKIGLSGWMLQFALYVRFGILRLTDNYTFCLFRKDINNVQIIKYGHTQKWLYLLRQQSRLRFTAFQSLRVQ